PVIRGESLDERIGNRSVRQKDGCPQIAEIAEANTGSQKAAYLVGEILWSNPATFKPAKQIGRVDPAPHFRGRQPAEGFQLCVRPMELERHQHLAKVENYTLHHYQIPRNFHHAKPTVPQISKVASDVRNPIRHHARNET